MRAGGFIALAAAETPFFLVLRPDVRHSSQLFEARHVFIFMHKLGAQPNASALHDGENWGLKLLKFLLQAEQGCWRLFFMFSYVLIKHPRTHRPSHLLSPREAFKKIHCMRIISLCGNAVFEGKLASG